MKKTITINISGLVFNIEEDAYALLKNYLESIGNKFNNLAERQEIIEDIEARIAELFSEKLNRSKEVINEQDVEAVKIVMGSPDNFEEDDSTEYSQEKTEPKSQTKKKNKKFYRDTDNSVLGGVCAGTANYFNWDVALVRVIFLLSVIFLGTGVLIYILFWIATPEAKSTSEKLAAKGKNATVDNISSFVTKVKSNFDNIDTDAIGENIKTQSNKFNDFLVGTSKKFNETFRPKQNVNSFLNLILSIIGFIFISIGIVLILGIIYGLILPENVNQIKLFIHELSSKLELNIYDYLPLAIAVITLIISVGISFILLGFRFSFSKNKELISKLKPLGVSLRFLIILSLISTIILGALNTKLHFSKNTYYHSQDIFYKNIVVKKLKKPNFYPNEKPIDFKIEKTTEKYPNIKIEKYAFGLKSNKINSKQVFRYRISDSIIYLAPTINFKSGFFKEQDIKVTLYLPDNDSTILINEFDD